jgi:tRNA nucleotidyltransferase (CCA-adding enzyme)
MVKIYQVGGSVRDHVLGQKSKDIDYAVVATCWDEMREYILSKGKIYLETPQYFTIRAHVEGLGDADFVLCRKDGEYRDGRHPDSVEVGTLWDDLARRDFTMNAIAVDVDTNKMIDPYGGVTDIKCRIIRCVRNPFDRFSEDALRILRALRFSITKDMTIDASIESTFGDVRLLELLENSVSWDRKKDELHKMFKADTQRTLLLLKRYPAIENLLFSDKTLWLEPTLKEH